VFSDNIDSGTNNNTNNNNFNNLGIGEIDSNELRTIYDKIKLQLDSNRQTVNRSFTIYSTYHPINAQLTEHEIAVLHRHLLSLTDRTYHLRLLPSQVFRMYVNPITNAVVKPSDSLLSDISR